MWVLLLLTGLAAADAPFVSEEGSFAVHFPGAPISETLTVPTPEGPQLRHAFRYSDDEVVYFIFHTCVPPPTLPADPEAALDLGRDSGLRLTAGTLISEKRVSINGHHGRRMVEEVPASGRIYTLIVLGDHGSYYSLGAAPRSKAATRKAQAFLTSFRLLPSTGKAWCHPK